MKKTDNGWIIGVAIGIGICLILGFIFINAFNFKVENKIITENNSQPIEKNNTLEPYLRYGTITLVVSTLEEIRDFELLESACLRNINYNDAMEFTECEVVGVETLDEPTYFYEFGYANYTAKCSCSYLQTY